MPHAQRFFSVVIAAALLLINASAVRAQTAPDAERVVSLGGAITEIVYALGAGDRLVGVDASSIYPEQAQGLPDVGFFRQVPAEGVLSLAPTLVLASEDTGPPTVLDQIRSAGVEVAVIPEESSVGGAKAKIRAVAGALGLEEKGEALIRELERDLDEARALQEQITKQPDVLFVYARGAGTLMVGGKGTSAEVMIELAGAENAVSGFSGYKPLTAEAVVAARPDVILMMTRGLKSIGGVDGLLKLLGIKMTPAGKNRRLVTMDDLLLLGFGPRLGKAVRQLTKKLHPKLEMESATAH